MPPILALILCTTFVLCLLRLERKQSPNTTIVLWIPTIWMLSAGSKPLGIWFATGADASGGSPLDRLFLSAILLIGLIILIWRKTGQQSFTKDNWSLVLIIGYMLMSVLWSNDQFTSFKRWVREMPVAVMALVILTEQSPVQALESLFRKTIYILIPFSVLLIKYYPKLGVGYTPWEGELMWLGVTLHKNSLGLLCLIAALFLIWTLHRRWKKHDVADSKYLNYADIFLLGVTLWMLKGPENTYSATAIAGLIIGLMTLFALFWLKKRQILLGANSFSFLILSIIILGITTFFGGSIVGSFSGALGRDATLTGRTEVWASLVPIAMSYPILGHGFGGFWNPETMKIFEISGSHNGYLDILLELGFVGLVFFALFLIHSIRKALRFQTIDFDRATLWICLLLITVFHNITESSLIGLSTYSTAAIIFFSICSDAKMPDEKEISA